MAEATTYERAPGQEARVEAGGSFTEALGGAATVVLAILGLIHISPGLLASIATILLGVAFLVEGGTLVARLMRVAGRETAMRAGMSDVAMESTCGAAGIVLGILALLGIHPMVLVPAAAIVFGAGLLSASGTAWRFSSANRPAAGYVATPERYWSEGTFDFSGSESLIGFAAIVLGILALAGYVPAVLSLVALLALGFAVLLNGSWMATRLTGFFS